MKSSSPEVSEAFFIKVVSDIISTHPEIRINLVQDDPEDPSVKANGRDGYDNRSCCAAPDWIEIGIYSDVELKLISLFHELGHCLLSGRGFPVKMFDYAKTASAFYEAQCWITGLEYAAATYPDLKFSESALVWAFEQVKTYV